MQINRLFAIVYRLLDKKKVTAKELASEFEVSVRTIHRDLELLSASGIPIYTDRGKGGGIRLLENFVLNKSLLSEQEQNEVLMSLQSLSALNVPNTDRVLNKLSAFFNKQSANWIAIDFSQWGSSDDEQRKFTELKAAILKHQLVTFDYFSSYSEKTQRKAEPLKIIFKGQNWYLYGYCQLKQDFRLFKITRMKNLNTLGQIFEREVPNDIWSKFKSDQVPKVTLKIEFDEAVAYRIYDEFDPTCIRKHEDGNFTVTVTFPESEWVYGYILSYGRHAEVLEPKHIRKFIKTRFKEGLNRYL
ncbi:YafY family transcriptional regulator [Sporolactobacillus shoreicorticis]|uniref:Helix-turn-helix transcriptional regulator n=1 Tax=Sporolactobacillus shoreicorticis TaxID=1923877 RepID=A0ABW5S4Q2_9BACL|nr:YafY family protein [Sporolactobacillus shoreicorticis]MCO7125364.1 YafY family transcriptional regulator [Sporolactobacillus shoreicorticis]